MALTKIPTSLLDTSGHISLVDNEKIRIGAGPDLEIYHDGSDSYIKEDGTGNLIIAADDFRVTNVAVSEVMIGADTDGVVSLYHNGTAKLATSSAGVTVTGALSITGDGSNAVSFTESGAGLMTIAAADDFVIDAGSDIILDADGGDIRFKDGGTEIGVFENSSSDFQIKASVQDKDIIFRGNDGGSGVNALVLDMSSAGAATFNSDVTVGGNLTVSGTTTTVNSTTLDVADKNITINKGSGDTSSSADGAGLTIQDAVDASNDATLLWVAATDKWAFSHGVTAPALTVDDITIDGSTISDGGDLTVDVAGGIILDADDSGTISFKDGGTRYGLVQKASNNFEIQSMISDGDLVIKGNDDGSTITALTLDMSDAGKAKFNGSIIIEKNSRVLEIADAAIQWYSAETSDYKSALFRADDYSFKNAGNTVVATISSAGAITAAGAQFSGDVGVNMSPSGYGNLSVNGTGVIAALRASSGTSKLGFYEAGAGRFYLETLSGQDGLKFMDGDGTTEHMRIMPAGNLGVNSSNPQCKFVVCHTDGHSGIEFSMGSSLNYIQSYDRNASDYVNLRVDGENVMFATANGTQRMKINDHGGVAIGTNHNGYSGQILAVKSGTDNNVFYGESTDANCIMSVRDNSSTSNIGYGAIANAHVFFQDGTEVARISTGSADKYPTSGNGGIGGSGTNLHLLGDDSEIRMANQIIHSDNSGNTKFTIRNAYGHHSSLAELSLDGGFVTLNCGSSYTEMVKASTAEVVVGQTGSYGYYLRVQTTHGNGSQGAQNSSYYHHTTDRSYNYWGNACYASGGFHTYSDETLKKEITTLTGALDSVAKMNGVTFKWKDPEKRGGNSATGKQFGVIAQNMLEVDSELPILNDDPLETQENLDDSDKDTSYYSMDYSRLTPYFIEAIKELKAKNEALEARIATLEG